MSMFLKKELSKVAKTASDVLERMNKIDVRKSEPAQPLFSQVEDLETKLMEAVKRAEAAERRVLELESR